mgnify:FL=1
MLNRTLPVYLTEYIIDKNNKPIIYLFCRQNKQKKIISVKNFEPYIYIEEGESINHPLIKRGEDCNTLTLDGKKVKKVFLNTPNDTYEVRKSFPQKTYEADILFPQRFLIDNIDKIEKGDYRIGYLDIETTTTEGFPDYKNPVQNIIAISIKDSLLPIRLIV